MPASFHRRWHMKINVKVSILLWDGNLGPTCLIANNISETLLLPIIKTYNSPDYCIEIIPTEEDDNEN